MDIKKIAVVLIALIAGGAAFYLTLSSQGDDDGGPVTIVQAQKEKTISVLVAADSIARGDRLNADNTKWEEWPEKTVKKNEVYFTGKEDDVIENLEGAVAKSTFVAGEPLIEEKIVRAGSNGLMAAIMTPGMRAVALRVTAETASGGFILPGDRVDIVFTSDGGRNTKKTVSTIFSDIKVLAVNDIFTENPETPVIEGVNVTLEMTPNQAEEFISARSSGNLSLTLRSIYDNSGSVIADPGGDEDSAPVIETKKRKVKIIRIGRS